MCIFSISYLFFQNNSIFLLLKNLNAIFITDNTVNKQKYYKNQTIIYFRGTIKQNCKRKQNIKQTNRKINSVNNDNNIKSKTKHLLNTHNQSQILNQTKPNPHSPNNIPYNIPLNKNV